MLARSRAAQLLGTTCSSKEHQTGRDLRSALIQLLDLALKTCLRAPAANGPPRLQQQLLYDGSTTHGSPQPDGDCQRYCLPIYRKMCKVERL